MSHFHTSSTPVWRHLIHISMHYVASMSSVAYEIGVLRTGLTQTHSEGVHIASNASTQHIIPISGNHVTYISLRHFVIEDCRSMQKNSFHTELQSITIQ